MRLILLVASPQALLARSLMSEQLSSVLKTVCTMPSSTEAGMDFRQAGVKVLYQNAASLHWHGCATRASTPSSWLADRVLARWLDAPPEGALAALVGPSSAGCATFHARSSPAPGSSAAASAAPTEWYTAVELTVGRDPVTAEAVLVVTETHVHELKAFEREADLLEAIVRADAQRRTIKRRSTAGAVSPSRTPPPSLSGG